MKTLRTIGILTTLCTTACSLDVEDSVDSEPTGSVSQDLKGGHNAGWEAVVRIKSDAGGCTGIRLNTKTILTAAHCVDHESSNREFSVYRTEVTGSMGSYSYREVCAPGTRSKCKLDAKVIAHPDGRRYYAHDFAVLIARDTELPWLNVSNAPLLYIQESSPTGPYTVYGSGIAPDTLPARLRAGSVSVDKWQWWLITDRVFLTDPVHVCFGDSGGPLVQGTATLDGKLRTVVAGVTASGNTTSETRDCLKYGETYWGTTYANWQWLKNNVYGGCRERSAANGRFFLDCS